MNKNIIIVIGFVLVAIIGYQAYLLNKPSDTQTIKTEKEQPNITIEIEKKSIEEEVKELNTPHQTQNQIKPEDMFNEEQIKEDLNRLFANIFGNQKLQEGIKEGMKEMQEQLQKGLKEMEKGLGDLSSEFEKLSKNDPFFKDLFDNFAQTNRLQFTDRGDDYYLELNIPGGDESKIDIKTKGNLLTLTITQKTITKQQNQNSTIKSESLQKHQNILLIPDDAFIDKLETNYKDGILEITIPKIEKVPS